MNTINNIAENYHERYPSGAIHIKNQICECCASGINITIPLEHNNRNYSKDIKICSNCYCKVFNIWNNATPPLSNINKR
jgi:hypothetical protein